jgi:molybdenum cofactor cytidylyltransferase
MELGAEQMEQKEPTNPAEQAPIAALVLAAGRSARMARHKLLLPLGDRALVAHAVTAACASAAEPVIVVLGREAEQVRAALPSGRFLTVENPRFAEGLATSLRVGLATVPSRCVGALVLLGDQPLITPALINRLLAAARVEPDAICAASYAGHRGNPVCFPRCFLDALAALAGDDGGRVVLARHPDRVRLVECADVGMELDADTPNDYQRLIERWDDWRRAIQKSETPG